ncbi:hypothetical protein A3F66_04735 [candidate division TM6 bacterium RIFCSPHIGHO2_12_FULL_32_22]|nr:MAG: hypothetical protein A3F66_04735 [candidate division TM6 bacterium RIFCSPHIGHO2_12_FULL_32_22]
MIPYLFQIYGPLYANCYGLAILLGIIVLILLSSRDKKLKKLVTHDQLINIIIIGTIVGIIGGMILWGIVNYHTLENWTELFEFWNGGLSILGVIIAISIFIPIYLKYKKIPVIKFLDRITVYTALTQSIARIGCFCAGCCYGIKTNTIFGVTYTHPDSGAPLYLKIHPAQLYSSILLLLIFLLIYFVLQKYFKKPGQIFTSYLFLISLERFITDFIRADREFSTLKEINFLSINQWIALIIILISTLLFIHYSRKKSGQTHENFA